MKFIFALMLVISTNVFAEGINGGHNMQTDYLTKEQQLCYAKAMIGFDSVVNSRVGLYPETALDLVNGHERIPPTNPMNRISLLKTIWGAYLFKGPAHTYAVMTFANCLEGVL